MLTNFGTMVRVTVLVGGWEFVTVTAVLTLMRNLRMVSARFDLLELGILGV